MKRLYGRKQLPGSPTLYILEGLVPYTKANIKLTFKPALFFSDLEKIDRQNKWRKQQAELFNRKQHKDQRNFSYDSIRQAFYRARKKGLVFVDEHGIPRLTTKGKQLAKLYKPKKLSKSKLFLIYDIPENCRDKRQHLRSLLFELGFKKVQHSVWASEYDHRELLKNEVKALELGPYVELYESVRLM